jgi:hypothetical protein
MHPTMQFNHTNGSHARRFQCPLLFPQKTGQTCEHEQCAKGKGCVKDVNWELGGIQRVTLDRTSPLFRALSNQRTACERINSQAKELGIERPRVRNGLSVANLNTLISVVIHVRAIERARSINTGLLSIQKRIRYMNYLHPSHEHPRSFRRRQVYVVCPVIGVSNSHGHPRSFRRTTKAISIVAQTGFQTHTSIPGLSDAGKFMWSAR